MDPRDPFFNAADPRTRYDPPAPLHAPHSYYPRPQFRPPAPRAPLPPPRQHRDHHHHHQHPGEPRLYFPQPHHHQPPYDPRISDHRRPHHLPDPPPPPPPAPAPLPPLPPPPYDSRVSDRRSHHPSDFLHPLYDPRVSDCGPPHPYDPRVRVFDEQRDLDLDLDWEREGSPNYYPDRDRFIRIREDENVEEEFRDRVRVRSREDVIFEEEEEEEYPPRPPLRPPFHDAAMGDSVELGPVEIGYHDGNREGFHENRYVGGNKGKRKWVSMGNEDGGFQENYYPGNRGKRKIFNGAKSQYNEWNSPKKPGQKTSALGRIQSGISVWNRIEEKPPSPPPDDFSHLGFLDEDQPELDSLDLSYKSNALVAKVVVPFNSDLQPSVEEKGPKVVVPKNRMKMKKVANNRESVVIPIVSSVVSRLGEGTKKQLSYSPQVSNHSEGTKKENGSSSKPVSDGSGKAVSPCGEPGNDATKRAVGSISETPTDVTVKAFGSTSKPASGGSKKVIGSNNKSIIVGPKKVIVSPSKPVIAGSKKVIGSSSKPVIAGSKKTVGSSSSKPVGGARKKVAKVAVRKIPSKRILKSVESRISKDAKQEDKVSKKKPINNSQLCPPGPTIITSIENVSREQYGNDNNLLQGPVVEMQSIENNCTEQAMKDSISVNSTLVVSTSTEDATLVPVTVIPTTSGEENFKQKDFDLDKEQIASQSVEYSIAEGFEKDAISGQGNDTTKENSVMPVQKIGQDFSSPFVSDARVVIDISSDSSPELTILTSETILPLDDMDTTTEDPSKKVREAKIPSFSESSALAASHSTMDARGMHQETISVATMASPCLSGFLKDQKVKREGEEAEKQHDLDVPSGRSEIEILNEGMNENCHVVLPSDMGILGRDLSSSDGAVDTEDYCIPILEDSVVVSVNNDKSEIMDQPLPSNLSGNANMLDAVRDQDKAVTCEKQSNSHLLESELSNKSDNTNNQVEKPNSDSNPLLVPKSLLASEVETLVESDKTMQSHHPVSGKTQLVQLYEPKKQTSGDARLTERISKNIKPIFSPGVPRVSLKETTRSSHSARNKTWRRTDIPFSASPLHGDLHITVSNYKQSAKKQSPKKLGRASNASYVRKGNSLIREPANVVPPSSIKSHLIEGSMTAGSKVHTANHKTYLNPSIERPKTPPLPLDSELSNCMTDPKEFPQPILEDLAPVESQNLDLLSSSLDNLNNAIGIKSEPVTRKRMIYVKRKSNQLIAAPPRLGFGDSSTHLPDNVEKSSSSSDLYYMRKKNQLILNASSSDSQHKQDGIVPIDNLNSVDHGASNVSSGECSKTGLFKTRLDKVLRKVHRHSKFSRVWTLSGGESDKKVNTVMPYLFPWKRTVYSKFSASKAALRANVRPLSSISRKLQLTRKRDTIYTVSTDGFSLRKAGVVSIGGSNLKWSKSIERHSKKVNEEATLAVAEVERKKRERKRRRSIGSREKNKNCFMHKSATGIDRQQGERIFRVGSVRYKMDSSKRTLIRIPDEQSAGAVGQQSGNNTFVPRRLLIGNDEYIRLGNGNQLVRDPKKLIRILASEKVRWSLHTARLRLAKKQQYCQFFTRFGRCNKNSGKCPYIHDPEKVAICTKFLKGICTDVNCKLTHKIIPERMPDCSYFLQGLCTNINCPYRHVHVNPSASVCDGFLRGYCVDGDECRKKHSYVCPTFEATGKCPQGSKCKLHHPKSKNKSKKRKRKLSKIHSNTMGRYFGSKIMKVGEFKVVPEDKSYVEKDEDPFYSNGRFAEFIRIDFGSDNEGHETNDLKESNTKESDSDLSDMLANELDELIKPVHIMNKTNSLTSAPNFADIVK